MQMADKHVSHVWISVLKFELGWLFLDGKFPRTGGTSRLMCCLKRGLNSRTGVVYIGDLGWVVADKIDRSFYQLHLGLCADSTGDRVYFVQSLNPLSCESSNQ
jgi:hypothetical protein